MRIIPFPSLMRDLNSTHYDYENVDRFPADLDPIERDCMICKNPMNHAQSCQAIRIKPCNHLIGKECMMRWTNHTKKAAVCVLCQQPIARRKRHNSILISALAWICLTQWCQKQDDGICFLLQKHASRRLFRWYAGGRRKIVNRNMGLLEGVLHLFATMVAHVAWSIKEAIPSAIGLGCMLMTWLLWNVSSKIFAYLVLGNTERAWISSSLVNIDARLVLWMIKEYFKFQTGLFSCLASVFIALGLKTSLDEKVVIVMAFMGLAIFAVKLF